MRFVLALCLAFNAVLAYSQDTTLVSRSKKPVPTTVDEQIDAIFRPAADWIGSVIFYSMQVSDRIDYYTQGTQEEYYLVVDSNAYKTYNTKVRFRAPKKMIEKVPVLVKPAQYRYDSLYLAASATTPGAWDTLDATAFAALPATATRQVRLDSVLLEKAVYREVEQYLVQVDSATYAAEKQAKGNDAVLVSLIPKNTFVAEPAYRLKIDKMTGVPYSVKFLNDENFELGYTFNKEVKTDTGTLVETYQVAFRGDFGKEYQLKNPKGEVEATFTIEKTGAAAGVAVYTITPKPVRVPFVLVMLILGALFSTLYFVFPNIRLFGVSIRTVMGKYSEKGKKLDKDNPDTIADESQEGEVSHFQALTAALSGTVGLGNIAGVAIALSIGGPGATFWIIVAGLLGMSAKFVECTLGVKYRDVGPDGTVYGGPMYYLKKGFAEKGMAPLGSFLAAFFALMCVGGSFGGGNMFQANQAAAQFKASFGFTSGSAGLIFGVVMMSLVALVIIGGIKRIGNVADKLVPGMAAIYIGAALIILGMNASAIPTAFALIFEKAFTPDAATGGFIAVLMTGFQRAAFSNEAGVGSAAIAHSAVRTKYPASEGIVALLEPFIDTVVICTMTALVVVITNLNYDYIEYGTVAGSGSEITTIAFESTLPGSSYVLAIAVILFAVSTMLSWSYYGLQAWKYLFGKSKFMDYLYKFIFCAFGVIGSAMSLGAVVDFSDAMIFAMVFPNLFAMILLAPRVRDEVTRYLEYIKTFKKSE